MPSRSPTGWQPAPVEIRRYHPDDEPGWARCRVLGFLDTSYFDDVQPTKPDHGTDTIELVATDDGVVVGVLDISIDGDLATIDTVAVHPDARRSGVATHMLRHAEDLLETRSSMTTLDAWTRDDAAANAWYRSSGFVEAYRYLHVTRRPTECAEAVPATRHGLHPVTGFFHATLDDEVETAGRLRQDPRLPALREVPAVGARSSARRRVAPLGARRRRVRPLAPRRSAAEHLDLPAGRIGAGRQWRGDVPVVGLAVGRSTCSLGPRLAHVEAEVIVPSSASASSTTRGWTATRLRMERPTAGPAARDGSPSRSGTSTVAGSTRPGIARGSVPRLRRWGSTGSGW